MPDLNSRGVPLGARTGAWLTDSTIIRQEQNPQGEWVVMAGSEPVADHGASMLAARAGHWLGFLAGAGLFGPSGWIPGPMGLSGDMQAGRGVAGEDGTIAVLLDYQSGLGLRLWASDGSVVDIPDARPAAAGVCVVDGTRALWVEHGTGQLRTCGSLTVPHVLHGPVYWPHALFLAGEWWIAYHSTDVSGVVLHPFSPSPNEPITGYKIALPPAFYLAAVALDATRVKLAWSLSPDDLSVRERIIDVASEPRVSLVPNPGTPIPNPGIPPEPKPMPDPTLAHLLRDQTGVIATVKRDYPTLGAAGIVDQAIHRLNRSNGTDRYGRKARNADGTNPNNDTLTIRLDDTDVSKKKLIDVLGSEGEANTPMWDVRPASEEPGNGYWRPAVASDLDGETPEPPDPTTPPTPQPSLPPVNYDAGYHVALVIADAYTAGSLGAGQSMKDAVGTLYHLLFGLLREGRSADDVIEEARKRGNDEWEG